MKQVIQNYRSGKVSLENVPVPSCRSTGVLVRNSSSLISLGTERGIINLGKQSLLGKALARPEQVRRLLQKMRTEGLRDVWNQAIARLDDPKPLGYSSAGIVIEVGEHVDSSLLNKRVACLGAGFAGHAEFVSVPHSHLAIIPDNLDFDVAAFGMLGVIALQGVKCAQIKPQQKVAVIGLGLLGQITAQLLKAYGCGVLGCDTSPGKLELAKKLNCCDELSRSSDLESAATSFSLGRGVDRVIITAATNTNQPLIQAAQIAAFRARIVLVGVVDIKIPRDLFWNKELEFQVSKAGGYDPLESKDYVYPQDYQAVSIKHNLEEFLGLAAQGRLKLEGLITHRFDIKEAETVYKVVTSNSPDQDYVGVLFNYDGRAQPDRRIELVSGAKNLQGKGPVDQGVRLGVLGAGLFGKSTILPVLRSIGAAKLRGVVTTKGNTAHHVASTFGCDYCSTDPEAVLSDKEVDAVVILTQHDSHAPLVQRALESNKSVFVEKPLATNLRDLKALWNILQAKTHSNLQLMVGFNRRYSPLSQLVADRLAHRTTPVVINIQVNVAALPPGHWVIDPEKGGGRIIGEVCHFVDLAQFLAQSRPVKIYTERSAMQQELGDNYENTGSIITFEDNSICNLVYTSFGSRLYVRERVTVLNGGTVFEIEDFKRLRIYGPSGKEKHDLPRQNLGHHQELAKFVECVRTPQVDTNRSEQDVLTTLTTLKMIDSLKEGKEQDISFNDLMQ